jgi:hypothetical protein
MLLPTWKGSGWMVGVIAGGCLLAAYLLTGAYYHDSGYYMAHGWPKLAGLWAAAAIVYTLLPKSEEVLGGNRDAGAERRVLNENDRFAKIKVKFWPWILLLLGVFYYFV